VGFSVVGARVVFSKLDISWDGASVGDVVGCAVVGDPEGTAVGAEDDGDTVGDVVGELVHP